MPHDPNYPWYYEFPKECIPNNKHPTEYPVDDIAYHCHNVENLLKQAVCLLIDIAKGKKYH